jgi:hypothetical protein
LPRPTAGIAALCWGLGTVLAAAGIAALPAATAHASCASPEGEVLWVWPADGAADVNPADGLTIMAFQGYTNIADDSEFAILLNDEPITPEPEGRFWGPIVLEPDTEYTLVVQLIGAPEYRATFSTGAVRPQNDELPPPVITSVDAREFFASGAVLELPEACREAFLNSACYDTGPRDVLTVTLAPDTSRPWPDEALVFHTRDAVERPPNRGREQTFLPAALCPPLNTHSPENYFEQPCVQVRYRVPDGRYSEWSEPVCADEWSGQELAAAADAGSVGADGGGSSDAGPSSPAGANGDAGDDGAGCAAAAGRGDGPWSVLGGFIAGLVVRSRRRGRA